MKKSQLEQRIREAYEETTPDLREKILASCEKESQISDVSPKRTARVLPRLNVAIKRVAAIAACLALFVSGLSLGLFVPWDTGVSDGSPSDIITSVYIDVNPSIELRIDGEKKVAACIAGNKDAEGVLDGLMLEGVDMNTALTAIVGSMYMGGYLAEDANSILVSVEAGEEGGTELLLGDITEQINTVFKRSGMQCSIIAQSVKIDDALKQRAEENDVSVGKMHLVDKMVGGLDDYDEDDAPRLAGMSIKELNLICSTRPNKDDDPFDKDITSGSVGGFVDGEDALKSLLSALMIDASEIEVRDIRARVQFHDDKKMVYDIRIKFKGDDEMYTFEVDCLNGEVVRIDDRLPERGETPDGEHGDDMHH